MNNALRSVVEAVEWSVSSLITNMLILIDTFNWWGTFSCSWSFNLSRIFPPETSISQAWKTAMKILTSLDCYSIPKKCQFHSEISCVVYFYYWNTFNLAEEDGEIEYRYFFCVSEAVSRQIRGKIIFHELDYDLRVFLLLKEFWLFFFLAIYADQVHSWWHMEDWSTASYCTQRWIWE